MASPRRLTPLSQLSPAGQARIRSWAKRHNLPIRQVSQSRDLRRAATGHESTPRTPSEALRRPDVYPQYVARHSEALAAQGATERGQRAARSALGRQTDVRGPVTAVDPRLLEPGNFEARRRFMTLEDAKAYANVEYGPNLVIWPDGPDSFTVLARKKTR